MAKDDVMTTAQPRQTVAEDLAELGSHASELAQERFETLKEDAAQMAHEGRERLEAMERSLEEYISQNPIKSMLIAAGLGLFVGRVILR